MTHFDSRTFCPYAHIFAYLKMLSNGQRGLSNPERLKSTNRQQHNKKACEHQLVYSNRM